MYSDVKVLTGAISPLGWCSFAATVVLFYREGGAKTPCKWCFQPVIYEKLSKKARKLLDSEQRTTWAFSPVTKKVESKKPYNRKRKPYDRYDDYGIGFSYELI